MSTMVEFQIQRRRELELWRHGVRRGIEAPGTGMRPAVLPIATTEGLRSCSRCSGYTTPSGPNVCRKCGKRVP